MRRRKEGDRQRKGRANQPHTFLIPRSCWSGNGPGLYYVIGQVRPETCRILLCMDLIRINYEKVGRLAGRRGIGRSGLQVGYGRKRAGFLPSQPIRPIRIRTDVAKRSPPACYAVLSFLGGFVLEASRRNFPLWLIFFHDPWMECLASALL